LRITFVGVNVAEFSFVTIYTTTSEYVTNEVPAGSAVVARIGNARVHVGLTVVSVEPDFADTFITTGFIVACSTVQTGFRQTFIYINVAMPPGESCCTLTKPF
jgi:hypothetical protein